MLGDANHPAVRIFCGVLKAMHFRAGIFGIDIAIFAGAFGDAAPAGIAAHIEHGREGHVNAIARGFVSRFPCRAQPEFAIKRAGLRQRDWIDGAMGRAEHRRRNRAEFSGAFLPARRVCASRISSWPQVLRMPPTRPCRTSETGSSGPTGPVTTSGRSQHGQLAELFGQRHLADERFNPRFMVLLQRPCPRRPLNAPYILLPAQSSEQICQTAQAQYISAGCRPSPTSPDDPGG